MKEYFLVNPIVDGMNAVFKGGNSLDAAKNTYDELSKHFSGRIKNFKFTLLKLNKKDNTKLYERNNSDFYHFNVNEKLNENEIEYLIEPLQNNIVLLNEFKLRAHKRLKKNKKMKKQKKLEGGKSKSRDLEDEDDSSDSDDFYVSKKKKFNDLYYYNWWYNPLIYSSDYIYVPTFVSPYYYYTLDMKPVVEIVKNQPVLNVVTV